MATKEKRPDGPVTLMFDNETLALTHNAHLTQVGFCIADLSTRRYLQEPLNVWMSDIQPGAHIDVGTVRWWMGEDGDAARKNVFFNPQGQGRFSGAELYEFFKDTLTKLEAEFGYPIPVYASPAMFDLPQLTFLFGGRKPWQYNMERDMMTLYKLLDPLAQLQPPKVTMQHDAAADAGWQMEYLFNLHDRLKTLQTQRFEQQTTRSAAEFGNDDQ